jgi:hypothetical protein
LDHRAWSRKPSECTVHMRKSQAPIGAFALRYDFADRGSSPPFFDISTTLSPFQKVRYRRSYQTSLGPVSLDSETESECAGRLARSMW